MRRWQNCTSIFVLRYWPPVLRDVVFIQVLTTSGRFTWPWDFRFLQILSYRSLFSFSVCCGRCNSISDVATSLEESVAAASLRKDLSGHTRMLVPSMSLL